MNRPVIHVRFKAGLVGETRRTVHVVPAPDGDELPDILFAYCGQQIKPGEAERVEPFAGMPCERCGRSVITAPLPGDDEPPALPKRDPGAVLQEVFEEMVTTAVDVITHTATETGTVPSMTALAASVRAWPATTSNSRTDLSHR